MTFLPLPQYPWLYSFDTTTWQVWSERKKCFLKAHSHRWYKAVYLNPVSSRSKRKKTHQIVAELFLPPIPWKNCLNHKDGNKMNDALENIERCTQQENLYHARHILKVDRGGFQKGVPSPMKWIPRSEEFKAKLRKPKWKWAPDDHRRKMISQAFSKPVACFKDGVHVKTFASVTEASSKVWRAITSIRNCLSGAKKSCAWFTWRYI